MKILYRLSSLTCVLFKQFRLNNTIIIRYFHQNEQLTYIVISQHSGDVTQQNKAQSLLSISLGLIFTLVILQTEPGFCFSHFSPPQTKGARNKWIYILKERVTDVLR